MVRAVWPEDVEVGRKVRRSQAAVAEERRICARFTGGLVDSFGGDDQHEEAELWVASACRGVVGSIGEEELLRWFRPVVLVWNISPPSFAWSGRKEGAGGRMGIAWCCVVQIR
jgi:hypothetical protein